MGNGNVLKSMPFGCNVAQLHKLKLKTLKFVNKIANAYFTFKYISIHSKLANDKQVLFVYFYYNMEMDSYILRSTQLNYFFNLTV